MALKPTLKRTWTLEELITFFKERIQTLEELLTTQHNASSSIRHSLKINKLLQEDIQKRLDVKLNSK